MHPSAVEFDPTDMYRARPGMKNMIIRLVVAQAPPGSVSAIVVNGWHTSRSDSRDHCTVDYNNKRGKLIERVHVIKA
ncbi:hypothetical protein ANO14919_143830 [Xylariales sp. No.14919]|nr:hypothetical protein ANO14919_143830 [Xylariales sp. No.14919]